MRHLFMAFCIVFVLASYGGAARGDDAQTLLAKNKQFAGWVFGDPSMNGLRLAGDDSDSHLVDLRRGPIWRRTITTTKSGLSYGFGYTGQRFWYSNENGFVVPIMSDGAKYWIAYQMVMNQAILLLTGTIHGSATVDGVPAQIVRLTPANADVIDAYIEPSSGRLLRAVIDPGATNRTIDILDFATLDGKRVISKWRIGDNTVTMSTVEHATIADGDFHPPAASAKWTFGEPKPMPIIVSKTRIAFRAAINGVEGIFLVDSGAHSIALNSDFADRAHIKTIAKQTSYGLNGAIYGSVGRAETLTIGDNVLHNVVVSNGVNVHGAQEDHDGLLGFDFLAGAIVDIDIPRQQMTLYDPSKFAVTAQGPQVLADLSSGTPMIPVTFNGRTKAHLIFDTGDPMSVWAADDLYGPGRVEMRVEGYARVSGAGGDSQSLASCGHTGSLEMGPIRYEHVPVCFAKGVRFGKDGGIIGLDFLKHFDLTFDYPESSIYLTPTGK
jgi:hypothetical protein